jgi:FHA domain-containing protein
VKFEVRYPTGTVHEVELAGSLAVLGRDPSCDLVVNDAKCSRRHAVVEAGPDGLTIRDSGSANGVYLNGKRIERSALQVGDEVRLGEVVVKILPDDMPGTLVMGPDEMDFGAAPPKARPRTSDSTPTVPPAVPLPPAAPPAVTPSRPVVRPAPPAAAPRPSAPSAPRLPGARMGVPERLPRPLTATVLAVLWLLGALLHLLAGGLGLWGAIQSGQGWGLVAGNVLMFLISVALGVGLLGRQAWARVLQIAVSALGLITCVMTPLSALTLYYMMRPATRIQFSGRRTFRELSAEESEVVRAAEGEGLFTGGVFLCLILSVILAGLLAAVAIPALLKARGVAP